MVSSLVQGREAAACRAGNRPRPFFLCRAPQTQQTHRATGTCVTILAGCQWCFQNKRQDLGAPCLRAPRGVGQPQARGPAVLTPTPRPLSRAGKEIVQSELGITQLIRGSDPSPWIPPSGLAEVGQDGAGGWVLSSSLPSWVRGTHSHGEKAARGCCRWEVLGTG